MKCPVCTTVDLAMSDRQGVEIDYCPQCRGVWLDRGELDKIIERSAVSAPPPAPERSSGPAPARGYEPPRGQEPSRDYDRGYKNEQGYRKKKDSFLGELFDF